MANNDIDKLIQGAEALDEKVEKKQKVEIRYVLRTEKDKEMYNFFIRICNDLDEEPRKVLFSLMEEWSMREASKIYEDVASLFLPKGDDDA